MTGQCTQYLSPGENQPFEMIELSAPARNGDSGGPILNSRGELAGVLFGSAFGRTSGSYCGRVHWFLSGVDGDFRRISAQAMLTEQSRHGQAPVAAINAAGPLAEERPGVRAAGMETASQLPPVSAGNSAQLPPSSARMVAVSGLGGAASAAAIPAPAAGPLPNIDRIKTILAAIGLIAVLYHSLRLLGTAVG